MKLRTRLSLFDILEQYENGDRWVSRFMIRPRQLDRMKASSIDARIETAQARTEENTSAYYC